ncbi:MAG: molybdopterin-dependent oxidoreductase [Chloroflexi bacterium]|nr:molybdopterin-dependent oxidoreductase [Chloroflexota bacterium]
MTPELSRRQFIIASGAALGAVAFSGCSFPKTELMVESPQKMPEDLVTGTDNWYATTCRICPAACGIVVRVMEGRAKKIEGNPLYPVNKGKICARGQAGLQALYHPDRLNRPLRRDRLTGKVREIEWEEALDTLSGAMKTLRPEPASVVLATSPLRGHLQVLVNRFLPFYSWPSTVPARHITYEPIESGPFRQAWSDMVQGASQGTLPEFDIARAKYIISFGADFLSTGPSPVQYSQSYGEFRQGNRPRGTLVQVEPRFSLTAANADRWIPVYPGMEGLLALSIAHVLIAENLADPSVAAAMTGGRGASWGSEFRPEAVSPAVGVPAETIFSLAREFAANKPGLAIAGGSAAAHSNGSFNMRACLALNYLTGSAGTEGGMRLNPAFPGMPGPYSASPLRQWKELAGQMLTGLPVPVKLLILRGVNPVFSLPGDVDLLPAIKSVPLVISFASLPDETSAVADLVLPEPSYLEEWGDDVPDPAPGFQVLGLQQPVVSPLYDTMSFADVLLEVSRRLGAPQGLPGEMSLPWAEYRDFLREGAKAIQSFNRGSIVEKNPEAFWNRALQQGGWWDEPSTSLVPLPKPPPMSDAAAPPRFSGEGADFPLHLIPFPSHAVGDGSSASLPWLQATPDPITTMTWSTWAEIGRQTSNELGLQEGMIVLVESVQGKIEAPVYVNPALPPGIVAMPLGQGREASDRYARERGSNPFSVLASLQDEESGALAWAATRVRLVKTGRSSRMSKFEGTVFAEQVAGSEVVQITT